MSKFWWTDDTEAMVADMPYICEVYPISFADEVVLADDTDNWYCMIEQCWAEREGLA